MSVLDDYPEGDKTTQLFGGVVAPFPLAVYGLMCIVNRAGGVPGKGNYYFEFSGWDAIILGITCLSFAAMLHFHYYWGLSDKPELRENFSMGKTVSLIILIASLAWVAWCLWRGFVQFP
jgi:hypothetical protein